MRITLDLFLLLLAFQPSSWCSTRLVGLAALAAVVNSDALYHSLTHFQSQVATIMAALLLPVFQVDVSVLNHE